LLLALSALGSNLPGARTLKASKEQCRKQLHMFVQVVAGIEPKEDEDLIEPPGGTEGHEEL
jgi:hypothetical protein